MVAIETTLKAFQQVKVLVIGDVMLDSYLEGAVERISPEAPVPIVKLKKRYFRLGGAANVALNLHALGAKPFLFSVIGADETGNQLKAQLSQQGIPHDYLYSSESRITTVKTRILAQNQQMLRLDEEDTVDLKKTDELELLAGIHAFLEETEVDVILFQDYNKGVLSQRVISEVILAALKRDIPTVVDPKNKNFFAYKRVTLFKPNLKEINDNLPFQSQANLPELVHATDYIRSRLNNAMTLITLSEKGIFYHQSKTHDILPTKPRNIADVCGAGDTVISVAALGVALNLPLSDIAHLANLAGGKACEKVGVASVSAAELEKEYLDA